MRYPKRREGDFWTPTSEIFKSEWINDECPKDPHYERHVNRMWGNVWAVFIFVILFVIMARCLICVL